MDATQNGLFLYISEDMVGGLCEIVRTFPIHPILQIISWQYVCSQVNVAADCKTFLTVLNLSLNSLRC